MLVRTASHWASAVNEDESSDVFRRTGAYGLQGEPPWLSYKDLHIKIKGKDGEAGVASGWKWSQVVTVVAAKRCYRFSPCLTFSPAACANTK